MDIQLQPKRVRWPAVAYTAIGLTVVAAAIMGVARLRNAAPKVPRASLWIDSVRRGELVREVSGSGRLVPEAVRVVSARNAGSVERILLKPGAQVRADSIILVLENPDLELSALEAAGDVKHAEAELLELQASLQIDMISQRANVENVGMQSRDAERQARVQEQLAERGMAVPVTLEGTRERASELRARLEFEKEHVAVLESAGKARLAAKHAEVDRLRAQAELRQKQVADLTVRAGTDGVLQELPLEVGQRVALGTQLAKVVDPEHLKVELKIPEARANELALSQDAVIEIQHEVLKGKVSHVDPAVQGGNVLVDVTLEGSLPAGAKPDLSVDGRVQLERLHDVLYTGKPASAAADTSVGLFKLLPDGKSAVRVRVHLGKSSVSEVEIVSGLHEGERVVLSDMSEWGRAERIELE